MSEDFFTKIKNGTSQKDVKTFGLAASLAAVGVLAFGLTGQPAAVHAAPLSAPSMTQQRPGGFADLVEEVSPAVVSIRVTQLAAKAPTQKGAQRSQRGLPQGHPLERFFRNRPGGGQDQQQPRRRGMSQGSGFVISADGYVVTNNHVVEGGDEITVVWSDGTERVATLIGTDKKTDLALLRVEADMDLPYVAFGSSDGLRVGDWVVAVGNPFGLGGTVTAGIVSARGRDIGAGPYDDFIQIDASINRGNSGGPTFGLDGQVVGVNTAIYSPSGGNVGIGFAIPSELAKKVIAELKENGTVVRGWLGVGIQPVSPEIAESLELEGTKGALVANVAKGSPAERAGLQTGDIIRTINGVQMDEPKSVSRAVADLDPNADAKLSIWRDGKDQKITVKLGRAPGDQVAALETTASDLEELGLALTSSDEGVTISGVDPTSQAAEKGLRPGDIIVKVAGKEVSSPEDVSREIKRVRDEDRKAVLLLVKKENGQRFVALSLEDA